MSDCIFCKIISGRLPSYKIYEDEKVIAFLDISPVNIGHTLFLPKNHAQDFRESNDEDIFSIIRAVKKIAPVILSAVQAKDFNFTSNVGKEAGQSVFHTHMHFIPRFPTDGHVNWSSKADAKNNLAGLAEKILSKVHDLT